MAKPRFTLRKIEMVEAVVKLGSISAAARAFGISQPALTQGLQAIETELGVKLFSRKGGSLVPTAYARPFLTHVDHIRNEILEAKRDLSLQNHPSGESKLRICAGIRSGSIWVDRAVMMLRRTRPEIQLSLDHKLLNLYTRLVDGEVDIGVTIIDLIPANSPRMVVEPLGKWRALFVCGAEHPLAMLTNLTIDQLKAYPLVGDFNYPVMLSLFNHQVNISDWPLSSLQAETLDAVIGIVTTRHCIAIVSKENIEHELSEGSVVELKLADNLELNVNVVLAYLNDNPFSEERRLFIEALNAIEAMRHSNVSPVTEISLG